MRCLTSSREVDVNKNEGEVMATLVAFARSGWSRTLQRTVDWRLSTGDWVIPVRVLPAFFCRKSGARCGMPR